ncbi:hypothetical protein OROMI_024633 [Orobanche minor]
MHSTESWFWYCTRSEAGEGFGISGVEIAIRKYSHQIGSDDHDEVPQSIPIGFDATNGIVAMNTQEGAGDACDQDQSDYKAVDKNKKTTKWMDGDDKKKKKKKRKVVGNGNLRFDLDSGNIVTVDVESYGNELSLNETVILNLQKQFEKVAAEMDSKNAEDSDFCESPVIPIKHSKRKRTNGVDGQGPSNPNTNGNECG